MQEGVPKIAGFASEELARGHVEKSLKRLFKQGYVVQDPEMPIQQRKELDEAKTQRSTSVTLRSNAGFLELCSFANVRGLSIDGVPGLQVPIEFAQLNLSHLCISLDDMNDESVAHLSGQQLQDLSIRSSKVTDKALATLADMTSLRRLTLDCELVTDEGLAHLARLVNLSELDVSYTQMTDEGLERLTSLQTLTKIHMGTNVTRKAMLSLAKFKNLERVELRKFVALLDDDLFHLSSLKKVTSLEFEANALTDHGLAHLSSMDSLRDLRIEGSGAITGRGLESLLGLRRLKTTLHCSDLDLRALEKLEGLDLAGSPIQDDDLIGISVPSCFEDLNLVGTSITDAGLKHLESIATLKRLRTVNAKITAKGYNRLREKVPSLFPR